MKLEIPQTSVWCNLEASAQRLPRAPCLHFYRRTLDYGEVRAQCERLAGFLQRRCGVRRGDRVALFMQNSPQFVIAYYAILRADAVIVPVNCMNVSEELEHVLLDSGARTILSTQDLFARIEPLLGRTLDHAILACFSDYVGDSAGYEVAPNILEPRRALDGRGVTLWSAALALELAPEPHRSGSDDLCLIGYTSGTTGRPKGAMHLHRSVMYTAVAIARWHAVQEGECMLATLPLFHVTGMQNSMNMPILCGSAIALLPRWNRDSAARLIQEHRVTGVCAVPAMVIDLIASPAVASYDLSSLRVLGGGGAAMPEAVATRLRELCGITYIEGYGLTETMAPTHINPHSKPKKQCLGLPIYDTEACLLDLATQAPLPPDGVGEIAVRGPQVFEGYWRNAEATEASFVTIGGRRFFRTGDIGRIDEEGYYFFVDRLKRMINAAGFKVWPAEVEAQLHAHPAVQEAVVIAKRDERGGEAVKAFVVLKAAQRGQLDAEAFRQWAREHMASYKVPREVEFVDSLPKSATGKVNWRALQEQEEKR
ncbi:MAG TPA: long-chain-fatty-acid--CoA ligase [Steroidobacteraceae bacterium]|nr:long-chain-fatty-acid--CoA ligase [Steroidobacteraceae bacterium]